MKDKVINVLNKISNVDKKVKIISCVVVILLVAAIVCGVVFNQMNHDKKIKAASSIDFSSETYKGKEISIVGNQIVIKEENGSKTIETINLNDKKQFTEADKSIKKLFNIDGVTISKNAALTNVSGTIVSSSKKYKNAVVTVRFVRNKNTAGTASALVAGIEKGKSQSFNIEILGDYSDCTYEVNVEYVD